MSNLESRRLELMRLSNVANTRLMAQEKNRIQNDAYYRALSDIESLGGIGTRFSRSKKLTEKQINKQFDAVNRYLNNPTSTIRGNKESQQVNDITVYDMDTMRKMSRQDLESTYLQQAKKAQRRMTSLQKAGYGSDTRALGQAKQFLQQNNLKTFTTGTKKISNMSDKDLMLILQNVSKFNNAKTSTVTGIKKQNKIMGETLKEKGFDIPEDKQQDFFNFLSTKEGRALKGMLDSNQFFEQISIALQDKYTVEDIKNHAIEYLTDNTATPDEFFESFETHTIFK